MKEFWNTIQLIFTVIGGWLGWFLGGCDGLLYALIAFVVVDYVTGVMCAAADEGRKYCSYECYIKDRFGGGRNAE